MNNRNNDNINNDTVCPSTNFSIEAIFFSTTSYAGLPISEILEDVSSPYL
jgi:hypothetical protein